MNAPSGILSVAGMRKRRDVTVWEEGDGSNEDRDGRKDSQTSNAAGVIHVKQTSTLSDEQWMIGGSGSPVEEMNADEEKTIFSVGYRFEFSVH